MYVSFISFLWYYLPTLCLILWWRIQCGKIHLHFNVILPNISTIKALGPTERKGFIISHNIQHQNIFGIKIIQIWNFSNHSSICILPLIKNLQFFMVSLPISYWVFIQYTFVEYFYAFSLHLCLVYGLHSRKFLTALKISNDFNFEKAIPNIYHLFSRYQHVAIAFLNPRIWHFLVDVFFWGV